MDEGMLDTLEFNVSPSQYGLDRDYVFIIKAEVRDEARAIAIGSAKVKVVKSAFFMQARIEKSVYLPDEDVNVQTRLLYPDGQAVYAISEYAALTAQTKQKHQTAEVLLGSQKVGTMEFSEQSYKNRLEVDSNLLCS